MARRAMQTGAAPHIIIRTNGDVVIQGWADQRVVAEPGPQQEAQVKRRAGAIEVQLSGDGMVQVPFSSRIELYCGSSAGVEQVAGPVAAFASHDLRLRQVQVLSQASAGWSLEIDCQGVERADMRFTAGRDIRCRIAGLQGVRYIIDDQAGRREHTLGDGRVLVRLKAGGEVSLPATENR